MAFGGVSLKAGTIERLVGGAERYGAVELKPMEMVPCRALLLTVPARRSCSLASRLGCAINKDGSLVVDEGGRTTAGGCYAAGDAVTSLHQLSAAAASGVRCAAAIVSDLTDELAK